LTLKSEKASNSAVHLFVVVLAAIATMIPSFTQPICDLIANSHLSREYLSPYPTYKAVTVVIVLCQGISTQATSLLV